MSCLSCFFFFNDTATTEIYTLSLHDALPICRELCAPLTRETIEPGSLPFGRQLPGGADPAFRLQPMERRIERSEEHTSELQSQSNLVCRLLLEKNNCPA